MNADDVLERRDLDDDRSTSQPKSATGAAPDKAATAKQLTPREVVAQWLKLVKADDHSAWDLTTRGNAVGPGPDFTKLDEFDKIRPVNQLGNDEQVMVVSAPFKDNAGQDVLFYAVLRQREGRWLIDRHGHSSPKEVKDLMTGFNLTPGMKVDVRTEDLVGHWGGPCCKYTLEADGTGKWLVNSPAGPLPEPIPLKWSVAGHTLHLTGEDEKTDEAAEITWLLDDELHYKHADGSGQIVTRK